MATESTADATFFDSQWSTRVLFWGVAFVVAYRAWTLAGVPGVRYAPFWVSALLGTATLIAFLVYPIAFAKPEHRTRPRWPKTDEVVIEFLIASPIAVATACGLGLLNYVILKFWPDVQVVPSAYQQAPHSLFSAEMVTFAISAVVLAPVCEEVFFRGFLFNAFRSRFPIGFSIVVPAAVFGFGHSYELIPALQTMLIGIVLTAIYFWRRTLVAPIAMHAIYNGLFMATFMVATYQNSIAPVIGVSPESVEGPCVIADVTPGSPADTAGLRNGDVIVEFNGHPISDFSELANRITNSCRAGDLAGVAVDRGGEIVDVVITLISRRELSDLMQEVRD